jgi:alpha,alpha-trehalase
MGTAPADADPPPPDEVSEGPGSLQPRPDRWKPAYFPISEHGVIGNNRTAVLLGPDGSILWAAFPKFDSPTVFAGLLDAGRGGFFAIRPKGGISRHRMEYLRGTNILEHRFVTESAAEVRLLDFCPEQDNDHILMSEIHRRVSVHKAPATVEILFAPRFAYGREIPKFDLADGGVLASAPSGSGSLSTRVPLQVDPAGPGVVGEVRLRPGTEEWFVFASGAQEVTPVTSFDSRHRLRQTTDYWRAWSARSTYRGKWRDPVQRSALLLKLLFYRPTGAMVAAPTTSLPTRFGGIRNWDYRFAWVRDTALAIRSLYDLGYFDEATDFVYWLFSRREADATHELHPFYTVDGRSPPPEQEVPWLEGYERSKPVRIGNAAHDQFQHDILGNIIAIAELLDRQGGTVSVELWRDVRRIVQQAADVWKEPDNGIWEARAPPRHYVYSKVMCWVGLERGAALGKRLGYVGPYREWRRQAALLRKDILERGRTPDGRSLAWYYGAPGPDGSLLRLAELGFLPADHPLMKRTVDRIEAELVHGPFLYRYLMDDGLPPGEGFFLPCSFWRIDYYVYRKDRATARRLFEELLGYAGPLGLFAEQIDDQARHLGNFPQGLTHLGLLSSACLLSGSGFPRWPHLKGHRSDRPLPARRPLRTRTA